MIHEHPAGQGLRQTRWTLAALLKACDWLRLHSLAGLHQLLRRLKIHRKRGRGHLHSPDGHYRGKLAHIWQWIHAHPAGAGQEVLLFEDEMGFYRQPSLSYDYERAGHDQPLAELGQRTNTIWRIAGALNGYSGQLTYAAHAHFTVKLLVDFYIQIVDAYPSAAVIYLVIDNWPVHYHADVLAALQPQRFPWPMHRPGNWSNKPSPKARWLNLPIQLLPLPTYAPWTNPIEKLWLLLRKDVLHLHRFQDDWAGLKSRVADELDRYTRPSPDLLRFVGLQNPLRLYHTLFEH